MRILFITESSIKGASFRYRIHQYIDMLMENGFRCEVVSPHDVPLCRIGRLRKYDIVFVQKKLLSVPWFFAASIMARRLFFDFDDAIWTCPNLNWSPITRAKVVSRLRTALSRSSCIIAGNSYLAEYAKKYNPNVDIIPTCVDTEYYRPSTANGCKDKVRIGWVGSRPNLIYLEKLEPVFQKLSARGGISLIVACDREYRSPNLPTEFIPWTLDNELHILHQFDIGVMPLVDDEWSRGKCGFKTIQYMACGIPSVSSRVGFNAELVMDGQNGFLAEGVDEWVEKLSRLLQDVELRRRIGREGRRTVEESYSKKVGGALLLQAITKEGSCW